MKKATIALLLIIPIIGIANAGDTNQNTVKDSDLLPILPSTSVQAVEPYDTTESTFAWLPDPLVPTTSAMRQGDTDVPATSKPLVKTSPPTPPLKGTVKLSAFSAISGNTDAFTGRISAGSNKLSVTGKHQFLAGQGIAIQGAGTDRGGWLITQVSSVSGNDIFLAKQATNTVSNAKTLHDDSVALEALVKSLTTGSTLVFDVKSLFLADVTLIGGITYDGASTVVKTPLYEHQDNPRRLGRVFEMTGIQNVVFKNFVHDGGKNRGVNGNDQFGTSFVETKNVKKITFTGNTARDNYYVAFRNLDEQNQITYSGNRILNTDVAICFMASYNGTSRVRDVVIDGNFIEAINCSSEAIALIPATYKWRDHAAGKILALLDNVVIRNNTINKPGRVALVYGGSIGTNIVIENNTFVQSMIPISSYDGAIELFNADGQRDPTLNVSQNITIRNNKLGTSQYEQLRLSGKNIVLDGNKFGKTTQSDVLIVGQDFVGTTGTFVVRNHQFVLERGLIMRVTNEKNNLSNMDFYDNTIQAAEGVVVLDLRSASNVRIRNVGGANTLVLRAGPNATIVDSEWKAVER